MGSFPAVAHCLRLVMIRQMGESQAPAIFKVGAGKGSQGITTPHPHHLGSHPRDAPPLVIRQRRTPSGGLQSSSWGTGEGEPLTPVEGLILHSLKGVASGLS